MTFFIKSLKKDALMRTSKSRDAKKKRRTKKKRRIIGGSVSGLNWFKATNKISIDGANVLNDRIELSKIKDYYDDVITQEINKIIANKLESMKGEIEGIPDQIVKDLTSSLFIRFNNKLEENLQKVFLEFYKKVIEEREGDNNYSRPEDLKNGIVNGFKESVSQLFANKFDRSNKKIYEETICNQKAKITPPGGGGRKGEKTNKKTRKTRRKQEGGNRSKLDIKIVNNHICDYIVETINDHRNRNDMTEELVNGVYEKIGDDILFKLQETTKTIIENFNVNALDLKQTTDIVDKLTTDILDYNDNMILSQCGDNTQKEGKEKILGLARRS